MTKVCINRSLIECNLPGAGEPIPLVLLQGTSCDDRLFAPLLARLDLAGRDVIQRAITGEDLMAAAARTLAGMPARAALLGFSLGGVLALEIARRAAGRVAGLALVGATARSIGKRHWQERRTAVKRARALGVAAHIAADLMPCRVGPVTTARTRGTILTMAEACGSAMFADQTEIALSRRDVRALLPSFDMPSLVVGGAADEMNPPSVQLEIAALIPDAALHLIPGAGHFTPLDAPDALAHHIGKWLARVDRHAILDTQELIP